MSRRRSRAHPDPVAVTCGGDVLVNAGYFDDVQTLEDVLVKAKREKGGIFIGFVATANDLPRVVDRVHDACREGAAFVVGKRQRRPLRRRGR